MIRNILLHMLLIISLIACSQEQTKTGKTESMKKLTEEEKRVLIDKGTEMPFTGEYYNNKEQGTYTCKQCGAALFKSDAKFDSRTGWPSFDNAINGAIKEISDADGRRTEIVCAKCEGHLGHVFKGEGFTEKNTRHCVNSICLNFEPIDTASARKTDTAIFANGCFWGTEYWFEKQDGVIETEVGYIGGHVDNPTYEQVCTGRTGHAEATRVIFNPNEVSYDELVKLFYETHDPEQVNRQGPDIGEQYRSGIFYLNEEQKNSAERNTDFLVRKGLNVATEITKATKFFIAEDYHQKYYSTKGKKPYCHIYKKRF